MKKQVENLFYQDIIQESVSLWSVLVHILTTEKDGQIKKVNIPFPL